MSVYPRNQPISNKTNRRTIDLVAGAFSSSALKARLSGEDLLLDPKRVYSDYRTMAEEEARLPIGERIDFVSIVTPNRTHVPVARAVLEAGFNVVCDKPLAFNIEEVLVAKQSVLPVCPRVVQKPLLRPLRTFISKPRERLERRLAASLFLAIATFRPLMMGSMEWLSSDCCPKC